MRRALMAVTLASVVLGIAAPPTLAECTNVPLGADIPIVARFVFEATVSDASRDVDPPHPDSTKGYDWHVEIAVTNVYRGHVADEFVYDGWGKGGCHLLLGNRLATGEELLVAVGRMGWGDFIEPYAFDDPFTGGVLVWRKTGSTWTFFADALLNGRSGRAYPAAAREATTRAEILELLGVMPDTSTAPAERPAQPVSDLAFPALIFVAATMAFATRRILASPS